MAGILPTMSITTPDDRVTSHTPVVATTDFPAVFPVFDLADISVFVNGVERFDFTVTGTFTDGISTNAKAVFSPGITGAVDVVGSRDPHRTNRFSNGGPLPISNQNLALDTIEAEMQETSRDVKRSHKAPYGEEGGVFTAADVGNAQENAASAAQAAATASAAASSATSDAAAAAASAASAAATVGPSIHAATAKTALVAADEFGFWDSISSALRKITLANFWAQMKWRTRGIGEIYSVDTSKTGVDIPPSTTSDTVWIELTAGLTGVGAFNNGKLTSESTTGSAPNVLSTAVINFAGSPMNGQTVDLLNTEGRIVRPSTSPGTKQAGAVESHRHQTVAAVDVTGSTAMSASNSPAQSYTSGTSSANYQLMGNATEPAVGRTSAYGSGNETVMKNVGVKAYMRIA